ncbi:hypothetical protein cyc_05042 [Cyclospora cayetanensis]|uniref:Uncharacterized protein n=1 Tax=Cyclospora cayetanensis TaxID=88456 RepID=A0A1D3D6T2_9EIME|nr:hypothetical protein cyc_05042 [Cyclospora cayetanensis]
MMGLALLSTLEAPPLHGVDVLFSPCSKHDHVDQDQPHLRLSTLELPYRNWGAPLCKVPAQRRSAVVDVTNKEEGRAAPSHKGPPVNRCSRGATKQIAELSGVLQPPWEP